MRATCKKTVTQFSPDLSPRTGDEVDVKFDLLTGRYLVSLIGSRDSYQLAYNREEFLIFFTLKSYQRNKKLEQLGI